MNILLLMIAIIVLLFSLRKMTIVEYSNNKKSFSQEINHNLKLLAWGFPMVVTLIFIPYQTWIFVGKSSDWDGVYIVIGTAIITILSSFTFYYRLKVELI